MTTHRLTYRSNERATPMRSEIEVGIADELDRHGVTWEYEQPVVLPDGSTPYYLPDFTIIEAPDELQLPRWVEGKPQEFLYALRKAVGIDRQYGEKFSGEIAVDNIDHQRLRSMDHPELWKPKRLAELSGESVLVISVAGASSSLSIEMRPDVIVFSRSHPFVNWATVQRNRQREEQRRHYQQLEAERQRQLQIAEANRRLAAQQQHQRLAAAIRNALSTGPNRYDGTCCLCETHVGQQQGHLYRLPIVGGGFRYFVTCRTCHTR